LSLTDSVAFRVPLAVGENVTLIVQFAPAARDAPQVVVLEKSPLLAPVIVMLEMLNDAPPVLDSVTAWEELLVPICWPWKVSAEGDRPAPGVVPVPVSPAVCGLPEALSLMESAALRAPAALGLNVTLMVQFFPAATLVPQPLVWEKSPLLVPVIEMLEMATSAPPELDRVTA
jgi:hypothetical protein